MKTAITIQARMTSTRLPGKVMLPIQGKPTLELMVERLRRVRDVDGIILCTTANATDDVLAALAARLGIACYRGSEEDVLMRVLEAARANKVETIVETTGDCPLIDPAVIESVMAAYRSSPVDYCSNVLERCYPIGMDTQVFPTRVLEDVAQRTDDAEDHEHVSIFIYRNPHIYSLRHVPASPFRHRPKLRLTLDTQEDLELITRIYDALYPDKPDFTLDDMLELLDRNPDWLSINENIQHRWLKR